MWAAARVADTYLLPDDDAPISPAMGAALAGGGGEAALDALVRAANALLTQCAPLAGCLGLCPGKASCMGN